MLLESVIPHNDNFTSTPSLTTTNSTPTSPNNSSGIHQATKDRWPSGLWRYVQDPSELLLGYPAS